MSPPPPAQASELDNHRTIRERTKRLGNAIEVAMPLITSLVRVAHRATSLFHGFIALLVTSLVGMTDRTSGLLLRFGLWFFTLLIALRVRHARWTAAASGRVFLTDSDSLLLAVGSAVAVRRGWDSSINVSRPWDSLALLKPSLIAIRVKVTGGRDGCSTADLADSRSVVDRSGGGGRSKCQSDDEDHLE